MTTLDHLAELVQPTPSGHAKLMAAWNGLTLETQVFLFDKIILKRDYTNHLKIRLIERALASANAYLRYLAARQVEDIWYDENKIRLRMQIEADSDPLVRYALLESESGAPDRVLDNPELFFGLPQEARLAMVRRLTYGADKIAKLVTYATKHLLPTDAITEGELVEITTDFLLNPAFKAYYEKDELTYDCSSQYLDGKDIETLWHLVPNVPPDVAYVLIKNLPEKTGLSSGIPADVLQAMTVIQLATLFWRPEVDLAALRSNTFFAIMPDESEDIAREILRSAAVCHLNATNADFARVLAQPDQLRGKMLDDMVDSTRLRLAVLAALHDNLFRSNGRWGGAEFAKRQFKKRITSLTGHQRDHELLELKLYRLADAVINNNKKLEGPLAFLDTHVVTGGTWATFMAFVEVWQRHGNLRALRDLPVIWEVENPAEDQDDKMSARVAESAEAVDRTISQGGSQRVAGTIIGKVLWRLLGNS